MMKHLLLTVSIAAASTLVLSAAPTHRILSGDSRTLSVPAEKVLRTHGILNRKAPAARLTRADASELTWGYCQDPYAAFPVDGDIKIAIVMPENVTSTFVGNAITGIEFVNPVDFDNADENTGYYPNPVKEGTIWLSDKLNGEPVLQTRGTLTGDGFEWSRIEFETPYEIKEATKLYIGVSMNVPKGSYGLVTDYEYPMDDNSALLYSTFKEFTQDGDFDMSGEAGWKRMGEDVGNICLRAVIEGDNLPQNVINFGDVEMPSAILSGSTFPVQLMITNGGANEVSEIELTFEAEGQEPQIANCDITIGYDSDYQPVIGSIGFNGYGLVSTEFSCSLNANNIPYRLYISKINGEAANNGNASLEGYLLSLKEGFPKNNVLEEGTGLWCQACPAGYAGMEYIKENIPGLIGIAMHYGDVMDVLGAGNCYNPFFNKVESFPSGFFNRNWTRLVYPSPEELQYEYESIKDIPAVTRISAAIANVSEDGKKIRLTTTTEFSIAEEKGDYGVAYVIVEDGLGPYPQGNAYSGMDADAWGFESQPNPVNLIFNDVIRNCSHPLAVEESRIVGTETGHEYKFETEITLSDVKDVNKYRLVAMVLNGLTGVIENACQVASPTYSGVEGIKAVSQTDPIAFGGEGFITLRATGLDAAVYTVDGACVATGIQSGRLAVRPGLYIVTNGRENSKVVVK